MLDRKNRPLWQIIISWVLIVLMVVSLGEIAAMSYDTPEQLGDEDIDIFNDDPLYNGSNGDDPPYNGNGGDPGTNDDPIYNGGNGGNNDDPIDSGDNGNGNGNGNGGNDVITRYIRFELDENPVEIENIQEIYNPMTFLLQGVRAFDESGNSIGVLIECHGESLLYNGHFDLERLLPGAYFTVTYAAIHPVTNVVFTAYRIFFISAEIIHTLRFYFAEGNSGVTLEDIHEIASPLQFLHEGVTVLDENDVSIEFVITEFDRIIYEYDSNYYFNLELMQPGEEFTLAYSAMHPMTGDIFTAERRFFVPATIITHSVSFDVDEYRIIIENIHEIDNPIEFLLKGITAVDENDEELEIEIIDTDGLLTDAANLVEIDGEIVFVNMGTELPTEDGVRSTDEDTYCEDSVFNIVEIEQDDEFVVTFKAVHPEDPTIYETVERTFVVASIDRTIDYATSTAVIVARDQTVRITDGALITALVTVQAGGTLIMDGGEIRGINAINPAVIVAGEFNMSGGLIQLLPNNINSRGVRIDGGGEFNMNGGVIRGAATITPHWQGHPATDPITDDNNNSRILQNPPAHDSGNNFGIGVEMRGGVFNMHGCTTECEPNCTYHTTAIHSTATAVNLHSGNPIFNMNGGIIFDNRTGSTNRSPGVNILSGTFSMHNGIIRDNFQTWASNVNDGGAGVRLMNAASAFIMHNGIIHDNTHLGGIGGGVHVRTNATFTMLGGTISRNTTGRVDTGAGGGGVAVIDAHFIMHDGLISENRTRTSGGGVAVHGIAVDRATFTMRGGIIHDNEATNNRVGRGIGGAGYYAGGGGVWIYRATFNMHSGTITHNRTGGYWNSWRAIPAWTGPLNQSASHATTFRAHVPAYGSRTSADWNVLFTPETPSLPQLPAAGTGGQNQNGGGVFALRNAHFNMHGGTISDNVAGDLLHFWRGDWNLLPRGGTYHGGGGIATRNEARVNITGHEGTVLIERNRSPAGGGIYLDNWSQVSIGGAGSTAQGAVNGNIYIERNVAYGRAFTNLLGWDGRGGGGIATGDGLYYGNRHLAHRIPLTDPGTHTGTGTGGFTPFDTVSSTARHHQTAMCVLSRTYVRNNISGGDGGGIYWWASSAVRMDDERYLHGLRVEGAIVENNIAFAGNTGHNFAAMNVSDLLELTYASGTSPDIIPPSVPGRIDDGLNNRHNLTPRHRVATNVVRNGRVNPLGMWVHPDMAEDTRINPQADYHFAGSGHHAFNNHDIRTVGGVSWTRPRPNEKPDPEEPMQQIQQGRVQLEVVGPGDTGAPPQGSDVPFPQVDMGNLQIELSFEYDSFAPLTLDDLHNGQLPSTATDAQEARFDTMVENLGGFPRAALPSPLTITNNSTDMRAAEHVYSVWPSVDPQSIVWLDEDGRVVNSHEDAVSHRVLDAQGNPIIAHTHHSMNVNLNISTTDGYAPEYRVTKVEVFGVCGCRVLDSTWVNVVWPRANWNVDLHPIPDGWAPGPYLMNHFCLSTNSLDLRADNAADAISGLFDRYGRLPPGLSGFNPLAYPTPLRWQPTPGDRFHHQGCLACRDKHPGVTVNSTLLSSDHAFSHTHILEFLTEERPYSFRPGVGFGAYGLIFRVTVEPMLDLDETLRLEIIGGSIDFGTHEIADVLTSDDRVVRMGTFRDVERYDSDGYPVYVYEDGVPVRRAIEQIRNGSDPSDIGFAVYDSRHYTDRQHPENGSWHVTVEAEGDGVFSSMLRIDGNQQGHEYHLAVGGGAPILNYTHNRLPPTQEEPDYYRYLSVCGRPVGSCNCYTRVTRVTWASLSEMNREIVVDMNLNENRIPPAERHRAILTWTIHHEAPGGRAYPGTQTTPEPIQQRRIDAIETTETTTTAVPTTAEQTTRGAAENNPPLHIVQEFDTPRRKRVFKLYLPSKRPKNLPAH